MAGNSILPVNTKSCCENMDVTGMLPQLDILYVVGCFQMCKKTWEYKIGYNSALEWELKSAPSWVGMFICRERQKKNQRKNSKLGFWLLIVKESINWCLTNRKTIPFKAIKVFMCKFFEGYNLSCLDTVKHILCIFIQKYLMDSDINSQRSNFSVEVYQEQIFYSGYCERFE